MTNKLVLCVFFLLNWSVHAALLNPEKVDLILQGEEALLNARWDEAYGWYDSLCTLDPADPTGYLFRAIVLQTEMTDREDTFKKKEFERLLDRTEELAQNYMKQGCSKWDSAVCMLNIGHQHAYRAVWEAHFGSGLSAITYGFKAKGAYQKGLEIDSTLYDLYLGMGSYHYWKSVKSGFLRYTGIFNDDREKGIAETHLAMDSSLISKNGAESALIYVMLNEEKYDSAIVMAKRMYERYPGGTFFLWLIAEANRKKEDHEETAKYYGMIFDRLQENPGNFYNIIEAVYYKYKACEKLGRKEEVKPEMEFLMNSYGEIPGEVMRKQRGKLSFLKRRY